MIKDSAQKRNSKIYWTATVLLSFGMIAGGLAQLFRFKPNVEGMLRLGYPLYVLWIISIWKLSGVVVLLMSGWLRAKEWAYAGFFFLLTGAVISHIISGDTISQWIAPLIFAILTVISWYYRPASRKLAVY